MSKWLWVAAGIGVYILLRSKKAAAVVIARVKPTWDPLQCDAIAASELPYIQKFKQAADMAFGSGSAGEVCLTRDVEFGDAVDLQVFVNGVPIEVNVDLGTIKSSSVSSLAKAIRDQG